MRLIKKNARRKKNVKGFYEIRKRGDKKYFQLTFYNGKQSIITSKRNPH